MGSELGSSERAVAQAICLICLVHLFTLFVAVCLLLSLAYTFLPFCFICCFMVLFCSLLFVCYCPLLIVFCSGDREGRGQRGVDGGKLSAYMELAQGAEQGFLSSEKKRRNHQRWTVKIVTNQMK